MIADVIGIGLSLDGGFPAAMVKWGMERGLLAPRGCFPPPDGV